MMTLIASESELFHLRILGSSPDTLSEPPGPWSTFSFVLISKDVSSLAASSQRDACHALISRDGLHVVRIVLKAPRAEATLHL